MQSMQDELAEDEAEKKAKAESKKSKKTMLQHVAPLMKRRSQMMATKRLRDQSQTGLTKDLSTGQSAGKRHSRVNAKTV